MPEQETFTLEKKIWTQDDYERMGWHDSYMYGMVFENKDEENIWTGDLLIDMDYIFKWVSPVPEEGCYTFWVSPCTLVFKGCGDLQVDLKTRRGNLQPFEISEIHLDNKVQGGDGTFLYEWVIDLFDQGSMKLNSGGFEQIVRQHPVHVRRPSLDWNERGGISFSRSPY